MIDEFSRRPEWVKWLPHILDTQTDDGPVAAPQSKVRRAIAAVREWFAGIIR